jgi:hypothetical protein
MTFGVCAGSEMDAATLAIERGGPGILIELTRLRSADERLGGKDRLAIEEGLIPRQIWNAEKRLEGT